MTTVYSWGSHSFDVLGSGLNFDTPIPHPIEALVGKHVVSIATGSHHCAAATAQGEVYTWGSGLDGQLGLGATPLSAARPTLVTALAGHRIVQVACGETFTAAISDAGELAVWGRLALGQQILQPGLIPLDGRLAARIACGGFQLVVLTADREVLVMKGTGAEVTLEIQEFFEGYQVKQVVCGQDGTLVVASPPGPPPEDAKSSSAPTYSSRPPPPLSLASLRKGSTEAPAPASPPPHSPSAIRVVEGPLRGEAESPNELFFWGLSLAPDFSDVPLSPASLPASAANTLAPVYASRPALLSPFGQFALQEAAIGDGHFLITTDQGTVLSWGRAQYGQLGSASRKNSWTPSVVEGLLNTEIATVAAGGCHSAAIARDGELYTWGRNSEGQLGHGNYQMQAKPTPVSALSGKRVLAVVCGFAHILCLVAEERPPAMRRVPSIPSLEKLGALPDPVEVHLHALRRIEEFLSAKTAPESEARASSLAHIDALRSALRGLPNRPCE